MRTATEFLEKGAETFRERNLLYGNNYHNFGYAMRAFFPRGVSLNSPSDFNRFGILVQIISKIGRYAEQFENGGHEDSTHDISVYAAMLSELDDADRFCGEKINKEQPA